MTNTYLKKHLHTTKCEYRKKLEVEEVTLEAVSGAAARSSSAALLSVPTKTFGDAAFSQYAPKIWNTLPLNIKLADSVDSFKRQLKTFFNIACNCLF